MRFKTFVSISILFSFLLTLFVYGETVNCTAITSAPYTISSSGVYCLTGNLSTNLSGASDNAITINADNVVLDLNGWTISNTTGSTSLATGIYGFQRKNITIRNGSITGFYGGIFLEDTSDYKNAVDNLIEDMRLFDNYASGISMGGRGYVARNNQIVRTGGSSSTSGAIALYINGNGYRVINNDISGLKGSGTTYGIYVFVANNGFLLGNRINGADNGIAFISGATGKYRDTLTMNVTTPYSGGTDAGNNN